MTTPTHSIHHAAAEGYQANADRYVKGRPDYPPEIAAWLRETIGLHAGMTVIDLGAGTGKFTPRLLETGAQVIAVEPVPQMLEKLSAALPQVKTLAGTAEAIPLPDESVDAVVCAQSFHWFARRRRRWRKSSASSSPAANSVWCGTCAMRASVGCVN